ncbi:MAG TPA: 2-amino-4-hydroxy-6-hydroxymethyldihydropteridine diphosphokinase [Anaerolineales bacterium]|nr:2-amino-4-hydroxy-6-hydroxymethyldihydropteridine diphosphokinase [Anaerolineales bacterium]
MPDQVFIALGSNLGDRSANLQAALRQIQPEVVPVECSPVYETPPWGYETQPSFLNQVIRAETELGPQALLAHLKKVETDLGRTETFRYGPRLIDLDILFYEQDIIHLPPLEIPHPALQERAFVLLPLGDLAPDLRHPVTQLTVRQMLETVDTNGLEKISSADCGDTG